MDKEVISPPAEAAPLDQDSAKIEKLYRKKAHKLNKQLYGELSKNVDLHNKYNRTLSILRKVNLQNQDLLAALTDLSPEDPALAAPAPPATLTKEQQEMFDISNV